MPTKNGVLSLRGNVFITYNCEKEGYATAEALELWIRMQQSIANAKKITPIDPEIPSKEATRAAASPRRPNRWNCSRVTRPRQLASGPP
jgi:hypothetical protein